MPNQYQITIINESGNSQSYLLFAAVPQVAGPGKVFQNVFMAAPPIVSRPNGSSSTSFTITRQFYGICGTSTQSLAAGVRVSTSDFEAVDLGSGNTSGSTLAFTTNEGANFPLPLPTASAPAGAYTISTDDSFVNPDPNNTFVGLGGMNMSGNVVPVATFLAAPSQTYNIFPVVKYYIATGSYTPGQIINVQQIGKTQVVDFTQTTYSTQTFIHNNDGSYSPVSPTTAKAFKLSSLQAIKVAELGVEDSNLEALPLTLGNGHNNGGGLNLTETQLAQDMQRVFLKLLQSSQTV